MAEIGVTINGRVFEVACDDGQEEHVVDLARYVDRRVRELAATVGQVGEARLLVLASLLVADELAEAYAELDDLHASRADPSSGRDDASIDAGIDALARRIEAIAARLTTP